jgi:hypothetical protein
MNTFGNSHPMKTNNFRTIAGVVLMLSGSLLFLDRYFHTGWLSLIILPFLGILLYFMGVRSRNFGLVLAGSLIGSVGVGSMLLWGPAVQLQIPKGVGVNDLSFSILSQIGIISLALGMGWILVVLSTVFLNMRPALWALIPAGVLLGLGGCLAFSPHRWVDYVVCLTLGVGVPLLLWGLIDKLIGLVIPGCLLLGIGPGVFMAWRQPTLGNGLTQTGVMLVWFAFGWILITFMLRWILQKYIWWPLIPGGIIIMVGMGLYIGGDPTHAVGFISNTGSVGLIILGLYLLLMRKGIHH